MRVWAIVAGLSLGVTGASLANPQDSPGTVYIDGLPCNLPCQSYMAWSRQTLKSNQIADKGAVNISAAKASRLHRLYDFIVETQSRRAERVVARYRRDVEDDGPRG